MIEPVLVLLPGLDGSGAFFAPLIAALPTDTQIQVIAYPPDEVMSLNAYADHVAERLPRAPTVVLAESFSSLVLLQLLSRQAYPQVQAVIFSAGFAKAPQPNLPRIAPLLPIAARMLPLSPMWATQYFCIDTAHKALAKQIMQQMQALSAAVLSQRLRILAAPPSFSPQPLPATLLQAEHDRLVSADAGLALTAHFPALNVVRIPGPHMLLQTRAAECAYYIQQIIKDKACEPAALDAQLTSK